MGLCNSNEEEEPFRVEAYLPEQLIRHLSDGAHSRVVLYLLSWLVSGLDRLALLIHFRAFALLGSLWRGLTDHKEDRNRQNQHHQCTD